MMGYRVQAPKHSLLISTAHNRKSDLCLTSAAASHDKAGVTVDATAANKNQQNRVPHLRLMEWVWSYFVDKNLYKGSESEEEDPATKAGAIHNEPSQQASGAAHWRHEEGRTPKLQKTSGLQSKGAPGGKYEASSANSSHAVSKSGQLHQKFSMSTALNEDVDCDVSCGCGCAEAKTFPAVILICKLHL